jgi:hypothetical protein
MGNSLASATCCSDAENPGRAERTTSEFPLPFQVSKLILSLRIPFSKYYLQAPLSARRQDLPPGPVVTVSPRTAQKFSQAGFPFVDTCSESMEIPSDRFENNSAANNDQQAKPINPKLPVMGIRYDHPIGSLGARKQYWKQAAMEESVGVGAHFEATQSGAIKVRGLSKGSPADQSGLFSIGDELIEVDGVKAFGRPLSELGQYVLGKFFLFLRPALVR